MEAIIERAAGLDVHQGSVVACIIVGAAGRRSSRETRTFGTMRRDLAALRDWLIEMSVTHVGMEATGIYWHPVHAALEGAFTVIVGNASHMRNVPGRKTDVKDAEWIADLVRHGLVRASFVPAPEIRVLRELIRHRKAVVGNLASERKRSRTPYPDRRSQIIQIAALQRRHAPPQSNGLSDAMIRNYPTTGPPDRIFGPTQFDLTDLEWLVIEPLLPNKPRGVPRVDDRRVLNGIFWVLRSGAPWRDLPERYGPRTTCYNRFVRWRKAGAWDRLMDAISAAHDGTIGMIDSTSIRAHQQPATAKRGSTDQCLGRSRGGLPTKIHVVVDAQDLPIRLGLTAGQAHDGQIADTLLDHLGPRTIVLADKAYEVVPSGWTVWRPS